ncbi:hypothetical protein LSAT2_029984 [Lamellibrachia satsuma]|nr:hypothetical protein LSAT2_029984 [Lamellibrachia satsuma]
MAYKYSQNPIFPRYYHLDTQPISPIYADKNRQPQKCALTGIRVMTAAYYRNRINTDKRNRVMDQRSDYMFINRKPACLCDVEREDFGTPVRNVERERHPDVNYDCFNNRYFRFSVDDQQPPYDPCSCSYHSIQSDPSTACPSLFEEDRISCPGRLNPRQLSEFRRRRPTSPLVIAEPAEDMTRNPGGLTQMSARSHIWPHNSQAPKTALRAANRSLDELPFNATYNNNTATKSANVNTNNNNNNNGRDDGAKNRSNNGLVVDDAKMARMRRSYRYVPPAPARYPHASTATCDQYEQLGLVLRGNLMLSSTYRENTSTEFRRSYTQDVADRRVAETDEFNMQKDELSNWNELRVVYDNILKDYGKKLQQDKDKKTSAGT